MARLAWANQAPWYASLALWDSEPYRTLTASNPVSSPLPERTALLSPERRLKMADQTHADPAAMMTPLKAYEIIPDMLLILILKKARETKMVYAPMVRTASERSARQSAVRIVKATQKITVPRFLNSENQKMLSIRKIPIPVRFFRMKCMYSDL